MPQTQIHSDKDTLATLHTAVSVVPISMFPGKWTVHMGPIPWPQCSPDLAHLGFNFWRFVKCLLYIPPLPIVLCKLLQGMTKRVNKVDQDMLHQI